MSDRSRAPITVTTLRIGRTNLGAATLTIDEEAITLVARGAPDSPAVKIPLTSVDSVSIDDAGELTLSLREGAPLAIVTPGGHDLREEILLRCRTLPELTRALRALGSRRGTRSGRATAPADQRRFFAPLIDARRKAVAAIVPSAAFAAFEASALASAIEAAIQAFAIERYGETGPARRALEAELADTVEPLLLAFQTLDVAAARAAESLDDLRRWRDWAAELRATFEVADRVWMALDAALDIAPWQKQ